MEFNSVQNPKEKLSSESCKKCNENNTCTHTATNSSKGTLTAWLLGFGLLIFGLTTGSIGIAEAYNDHQLTSKGTQATGEVTNVEFGSGRKGKTYAYPDITFTTEDGDKHTIDGQRKRYRERSDGPKTSVADKMSGQEFTVFYDPNEPDKSVIEGQETSYVWPILFLLFPSLFGGFIIYVMADDAVRKRKKLPQELKE